MLVAAVLMQTAFAMAQQGPVSALFDDEQKRGTLIASSFETTEIQPSAGAAFPSRVYLFAGDLVRAFDNARFRPDAAIVPTNTELLLTAPSPATQRVLVERVQKQPAVMRDLQDQIETRRKQSGGGALNIGVDSFVVQLPRPAKSAPASGAFPRTACLIATDFAKGGAVDRRELFAQDRVRKGISACLAALDAMGVQSLIVPLMGASSSESQAKDAAFEGQRVLKECRLMNSVAGIALGIHDFAPGRRNIREIGIVQWDQELVDMFGLPTRRLAPTSQSAYKAYSEQITHAFRSGLAGGKMSANDASGNCAGIFSAQ
jgi:hypothetical protein